MGKTIAVSNLKGGVGKTMTTASLSVGLAKQGKRVLCLDADAQCSLTISFGITNPGILPVTLASVLTNIVNETDFDINSGIVHHSDGIDILPASSTLAGLEITLAGLIGRETVLRQYIDKVSPLYDYVIVDCASWLDLLTINALAAANSVIIPVVPKYLDAKGLEFLLLSIAQIRRQINPSLSIDGILLTMVDHKANFTREIITLIENSYGNQIHVFNEFIPRSVRAAESTARGVSIFTFQPKGKIAAAYAALTKEVLSNAA
jgi:chromosome partitioning protein